MAGPLDYRTLPPDMSSSSPLANMTDLSSSDPISPGSPTPGARDNSQALSSTASTNSFSTVRRNAFLLSPNNSHPDPFSANAKASPSSHPSFGKGQLRAKHLRNSPQLRAGATASSKLEIDSRSGAVPISHDVLRQHFLDSSDDNPSSDEPSSIFCASHDASASSVSSRFGSSGKSAGLGLDDALFGSFGATAPRQLGEPFKEPTSPSLGKKSRKGHFDRTQSSSQDPLCASYSQQVSPRAQPPPAQRRRLKGTSPKKPLMASRSGRFSEDNSESESWDRSVLMSKPNKRQPFDMRTAVGRIIDDASLKGELKLGGKQLTSIHPVVADLAKFVNFAQPPRADDTASPPGRVASFSRTSSLSNASDRLAGQSVIGSPARTRSGNLPASQLNDGLKVYLDSNFLTSLPSALFAVTNMTVLLIRNNIIKELPPAIGQLVNLRELSVSGCGLRTLPAEIQQLDLRTFNHFPNPFILPAEGSRLSVRRPYGFRSVQNWRQMDEAEETLGNVAQDRSQVMGPPALPERVLAATPFDSRRSFALAGVQGADASRTGDDGRSEVIGRVLAEQTPSDAAAVLPKLQELCIRRLLQPTGAAGPAGGQMMRLDEYEAGILSRLRYNLSADVIKTVEAGRRSAANVWGHLRPASAARNSWCSGPVGRRAIAGKLMSPSNGYDMSHSVTTGRKDKNDFDVLMDDETNGESNDWESGEASAEWSSDESEHHRVVRGIDVEQELDNGDDARSNPWFNRCPNPNHTSRTRHALGDERSAGGDGDVNVATYDWPVGADPYRLFAKPCVQRVEWVSHVAGVRVSTQSIPSEALCVSDEKKRMLAHNFGLIPLLWRGCGPACLGFLDTGA